MSFCVAVTCIDGRVQKPVQGYLTGECGFDFADTITVPGPEAVISGGDNPAVIEHVLSCIALTVEKHETEELYIIGHHDCAANPAGREIQENQIRESVLILKNRFPNMKVSGVYIDDTWSCKPVEEILSVYAE